MRSTTARRRRLAAGLLAAALGVGPVSACSFTSNNVSCSGNRCTVTLSGNGAKADILGTTLSFSGGRGGRARLGVGDASVSCAQGESTSAGPLRIECTKVSDGSVQLTATV